MFRKQQWIRRVALMSPLAIAGAIIALALPHLRGLAVLGFYSIPSHMFISPFPHEPVLLYYAKFFSPMSVTIAATMGCLLAGLLDYWLLLPLMQHPRFRPKYANTKLFQKSLAFFEKSPFWMLVIAGYTPIPFYPFKFLSIAGAYPLWKYEVALLVGRAPRFYTLAVLGYVLQPPTWLLIVLALGAVIAPLVKKLFDRLRAKLIIARERSKPKPEVAPLASSPRRVPGQLESSASGMLIAMLLVSCVTAQPSASREQLLQQGLHHLHSEHFDSALATAAELRRLWPEDPAGDLIAAGVLQTMMRDYRVRTFEAQFDSLIECTVQLAERQVRRQATAERRLPWARPEDTARCTAFAPVIGPGHCAMPLSHSMP